MKIIQIVGYANSGKTTLIKNLISELQKLGKVGVVKHLGDHEFNLELEKDTTEFFHAGANISVGIDSHKTMMIIHNNSLNDMLNILLKQNINFVIIEGFKQSSFPKIVLGDLNIKKNCVLLNPSKDQIMASLDLFEDFYEVKKHED